MQVGLSGHAPKASDQSCGAFGAWPERPTCTVVVLWAWTRVAPQAAHSNAWPAMTTGQKGTKDKYSNDKKENGKEGSTTGK